MKRFHVVKRPKKLAPLGTVDLIVLSKLLIMYFVFSGDMLHRKESLAELIENLSHGRYLPAKVPAIDAYRKSIYLGHLMGGTPPLQLALLRTRIWR